MVPPPTPFHILRSHASPLATVSFNPSNTLLFAGDQDGHISITNLRSRRTVCHWKAHEGGILTLQEWNGRLISHGRDNMIHFYEPSPTHGTLSNGPGPSRPPPVVESSLTTNSLNFCRFSLCPVSLSGPSADAKGKGKEKEALLAVPNLVDSELVDIYLLPSKQRLHASLNFVEQPKAPNTGSIVSETTRAGIVMGVHLALDRQRRLTCVMGFEDGRVEVWRCGRDRGEATEASDAEEWRQVWDARMSSGPRLWNKVWTAKGHNEAVMAMAVDTNLERAFTVSADHLVVRYDLRPLTSTEAAGDGAVALRDSGDVKSFSTGQIGNASLAVSADGSVLAVGGWDGKIRLFSASSLKPLGTLPYHRETIHCLAFANAETPDDVGEADIASTLDIGDEGDEEDGEEYEDDRGAEKSRWLVSGGKDRRIGLWALKDFSASAS